ncbi:MAG: hypothetical protein V4598_06740 [Bdellovibrionota bacterium]
MNLKDSFPNLALFSDMDWNAVAKEYEISSKIITFPEYLEFKAEEGDCPQHLFELAYFDAALNSIQEGEFLFPDSPGIHLNPSACFLSFDHDILTMVKDAHDGKISVIERPNVLSVYVDHDGEICFHEISVTELELLQKLEEGTLSSNHEALPALTQAGLILSVN